MASYTKTTFVNGQAPAVSAPELNKISSGVELAVNYGVPITGTYTGDGTASRDINLGFSPSIVFIFCTNRKTNTSNANNLTAVYDAQIYKGYTSYVEAGKEIGAITASGFRITHTGGGSSNVTTSYINTSGLVYAYVAYK